MRIAISCHPTTGGSGIAATELALALADRGHEIHLVSFARPLRFEERAGVTFHEASVFDYPLFAHPPQDLCLANKLAEVVKAHNIELIHAHYAVPHAVCAIMARDISGMKPKVAATLHGTDITLVGKRKEFFDLVRHTLDERDGLTAVSEWLKSRITETFRPKREPVVIHNFVDSGRFNPEGRCPLAISGALEVIHASNFRPVKRVADVVSVFAGIQRRLPARLLLLGEGPELGKARVLAAELGISDTVIFNGPCAHMAEVLRCGHLFLLLSDHESFGLSALEAMACGVPVLGSDTGGLPEVVVDGETGILCGKGDIESAVERAVTFLSDRDAWAKMSAAAARRSRDVFGMEKVVARYEGFYESL